VRLLSAATAGAQTEGSPRSISTAFWICWLGAVEARVGGVKVGGLVDLIVVGNQDEIGIRLGTIDSARSVVSGAGQYVGVRVRGVDGKKGVGLGEGTTAVEGQEVVDRVGATTGAVLACVGARDVVAPGLAVGVGIGGPEPAHGGISSGNSGREGAKVERS